MAFGAELRRLRVLQGDTMGAFADRTGLSVVVISDLERGRTTELGDVRRYLDALEIDLSAKALLAAKAITVWKT